ncbi:hypothetical protein FGU71_08580 [Erythrobacter insulae]|uniref:Uncharacterized protein n=1 Tax=Erythrobacter insulae TaxID=2584124 RepID=A0A547PCP0_9SPHN|nr:hypothetical protein [Erythrobacter insulae]TRD11903.1 hypothetical protein FGU71_08580 [Erythrobacter insulae]
MLHCNNTFTNRRYRAFDRPAKYEILMSQQLAFSSLFSALALAFLCLASVNGMIGSANAPSAAVQPLTIQAEFAPGLNG